MATVSIATQGTPEFARTFEALTGHKPYPWQENLFREFLAAPIPPPNINLPTGAGKTSIISIWLIALSYQAYAGTITLPRRLVWVVNRRVVVDQATDDAIAIRKRLNGETMAPELDWLRNQLQALGVSRDEVFAISTLRGECEDNKEWSKDPSRPAVIIGTVDMIGSRLLFSGYGDGPYWRAQHAGLFGYDALVVNDEAHLTSAFAKLLSTVDLLQRGSFKPFQTIRLSATHKAQDCWPESLDSDREDQRFRKVFEASKKLFIQTLASSKVEQTIIDLASQTGSGRTVIFVTEPEKARKISATIQKRVGAEAGKRVLTLTGTMRGFERDELVVKQGFLAFTVKVRPPEDYWLVATSAGEVGINISADRLITGNDTLDHLIQRFGRLNRFGETDGMAYLIASDKEKEERAEALKVLQTRLTGNETDGYDISPRALFGFSMDKKACTPEPATARLHPWHIDVWSQTSLGRHPARPNIEPWLHGQQDDLPETYIAWREYADKLADAKLVGNEDCEEVFEEYPLLAHEQLREPTIHVLEKLRGLFDGRDQQVNVLRRKSDGTVDVITLPKIKTKTGPFDIRDKRDERIVIRELAYAQLILPPGWGRPQDGMFHPQWLRKDEPAEAAVIASTPYDVSGAIRRKGEILEGFEGESRASYQAVPQEDETYALYRFGGFPGVDYPSQIIQSLERKELDRFAARHGFRFLIKVRAKNEEVESDAETILLFFGPARKPKNVSEQPVFVLGHNQRVSNLARELATALRLPQELADALIESGSRHDLGKSREIWQRAAGNLDPKTRKRIHAEAIAKPIGIMHGRQLLGFRHEVASLLDAKTEPNLSADHRDMLLHLIASHHGNSRPCFQGKAYDRTNLRGSAEEALETVQRFARMQRKYGAWGLAYIEAILRAADGIASAEGPEQPPHA